jgi:hypothetical protein
LPQSLREKKFSRSHKNRCIKLRNSQEERGHKIASPIFLPYIILARRLTLSTMSQKKNQNLPTSIAELFGNHDAQLAAASSSTASGGPPSGFPRSQESTSSSSSMMNDKNTATALAINQMRKQLAAAQEQALSPGTKSLRRNSNGESNHMLYGLAFQQRPSVSTDGATTAASSRRNNASIPAATSLVSAILDQQQKLTASSSEAAPIHVQPSAGAAASQQKSLLMKPAPSSSNTVTHPEPSSILSSPLFQQGSSSASGSAETTTVFPCRARGMPEDHKFKVRR